MVYSAHALVVRTEFELSSAKVADIAGGTPLEVLEQRTTDAGATRGHVRFTDDEGVETEGWVTVVSDKGVSNVTEHGGGGPSLADWHAATKRCVLFHHLPANEHRFVQQASRVVETLEGTTLYDVGDLPSAFYLVHSGRYRVSAPTEVRGTDEGSRLSAVAYGVSSAGSMESGHRKCRDYGPLDAFGAHELLCATSGGRATTLHVLKGGYLWSVPGARREEPKPPP